MYRVWNFVTNYSLLLIGGALIALVWANIDASSYHHFVEYELIHKSPVGHAHYAADGSVDYRSLTLHYLVNDVLMAFFFAIAAKEVWEAVILKNGVKRSPQQSNRMTAQQAIQPFEHGTQVHRPAHD